MGILFILLMSLSFLSPAVLGINSADNSIALTSLWLNYNSTGLTVDYGTNAEFFAFVTSNYNFHLLIELIGGGKTRIIENKDVNANIDDSYYETPLK